MRRIVGRFSPLLTSSYSPILTHGYFMEAERRLFLRIIIQQIEDITDKSPIGAKSKPEKEWIRNEATKWFRQNSTDYREVCESAGIDSKKLREIILTAEIASLQRLCNEYRKLI